MSEPLRPPHDLAELSSSDIQLDLAVQNAISDNADHIKCIKLANGSELESLTLYTSPDSRKKKITLTANPEVDGGNNTLAGSNVLSVTVKGNANDESTGDFLYSSRDSWLHRRFQPDRLKQELGQPTESVRASIASKLETGVPEKPMRRGRVAKALSKLHLAS